MSAAAPIPCPEFDPEFQSFAEQESQAPVPGGSVLFYGSSSIRFWETLAADFPDLPVVNRGFGGATLANCLYKMERLVFPLNPRAIVLYAGENDLDHGTDPEVIPDLYDQFAGRVADCLGPVPIVFISIKPSVARAAMTGKIRRANGLIFRALPRWPHTSFLDVFPLMLDGEGRARRELFTGDGLHMSRAGYQLWTSQVRPMLAGSGVFHEPRISQMV